MKTIIALAVGAILLPAQVKTTQDGVYSAAQAKRGALVYEGACASCHGADLAGDGQSSPLTGKDFATTWNGQPLGDLFERIHATMPADAPGTLKTADVAAVIAYILEKSAFPAGLSELPADQKSLKDVTFIAPKP
jgi:mono/diheme cytochrome c family protein